MGALGAVEGFRADAVLDVHDALEHRLRRALDRDKERIRVMVDRRHHAGRGVEGMFGNFRELVEQDGTARSGRRAELQKRDFHRIAGAGFAVAAKRGVVAKGCGLEQRLRIGMCLG